MELQCQAFHLGIWASISLEKQNAKPGVVVHTGRPMTWYTEAGQSGVTHDRIAWATDRNKQNSSDD